MSIKQIMSFNEDLISLDADKRNDATLMLMKAKEKNIVKYKVARLFSLFF